MTTYLRRLPPDLRAVTALVLLWLFFFWRLFTPIAGDQASLRLGDFSGQFVAFAGYQYERFTGGEVPLWNPYNNGGFPFIADTQAAVFYPPRLITIGFASASGGWTYHALELEMTFHVLAYTLLTYLLVRRMTLGQRGSIFGGMTSALISGYGGFMSGYPPLQLAILEAATWTPLALLGILEATRSRHTNWAWFALTGTALGLSWLAGHPQTSYFITLLLIMFAGWRIFRNRSPLIVWILACSLFGLIAMGLAAVQLLPGLEYLGLTARFDFGFDAKGNGFPFHDVIQFIYPNTVSLFSPLYVGFFGLALAALAVWRKLPDSRFWLGVAVISLIWSFGANSSLYALFYQLLPGLRFFRGQERAAFLVMTSLSVLAGLGAVHAVGWHFQRDYMGARRLHTWLRRMFAVSAAVAVAAFVLWQVDSASIGEVLPEIFFGTGMIAAAAIVIPLVMIRSQNRLIPWLLIAAVAFELFTVNMDSDAVYDRTSPVDQIAIAPPELVQAAMDEVGNQPYRVDGFRGLHDNYGSLYGVQDIRGISPLFLTGAFSLIEGDISDERSWEVFAVRYVYSDWQELAVPTVIQATGHDRYGPVSLHELTDPRPFAQVMYDAWFAADDTEARAVLNNPDVDPRRTAILSQPVAISLDAARSPIPAQVIEFKPEQVIIRADTPVEGLLSVAMVSYPGWVADMDGQPTNILTNYGALTAIVVPPGEHLITLRYDPPLYRVGALLSLATLGGLCILAIIIVVRQLRRNGLHR